jgi:hypothetical protein
MRLVEILAASLFIFNGCLTITNAMSQQQQQQQQPQHKAKPPHQLYNSDEQTYIDNANTNINDEESIISSPLYDLPQIEQQIEQSQEINNNNNHYDAELSSQSQSQAQPAAYNLLPALSSVNFYRPVRERKQQSIEKYRKMLQGLIRKGSLYNTLPIDTDLFDQFMSNYAAQSPSQPMQYNSEKRFKSNNNNNNKIKKAACGNLNGKSFFFVFFSI